VLRALLFDFNGVIVDDEPLHHALLQRVLAEEGVELDLPDPKELFLGREDRACLDMALSRAGQTADPVRLTRLQTRKDSYYQEVVRREGYDFFPGALELVREASSSGLMLGMVSGARREEIERALDQAGVRGLFKFVIAGGEPPRGKPDPRGYLMALERLNSQPPLPDRLVHPHEVLAIEDSVPGLAAAQDAGLVTLGVAHSHPAERLRLADAVVERLEGLCLAELQTLLADASRQ
jgi:beta-phosphoglucomutase